MLIANVMGRFLVSNTVPTSQNCLITDRRARGLNKTLLGAYTFSPNVALMALRLINLGLAKPTSL